jgi:hypothetical protein
MKPLRTFIFMLIGMFSLTMVATPLEQKKIEISTECLTVQNHILNIDFEIKTIKNVNKFDKEFFECFLSEYFPNKDYVITPFMGMEREINSNNTIFYCIPYVYKNDGALAHSLEGITPTLNIIDHSKIIFNEIDFGETDECLFIGFKAISSKSISSK